MSLETNRLYSYEIIQPHLPLKSAPTCMNYVIRCSKTKVIYSIRSNTGRENKNDIQMELQNKSETSNIIKLEHPTEKEIIKLKKLYAMENIKDDVITYDKFNISLNSGDYISPIIS